MTQRISSKTPQAAAPGARGPGRPPKQIDVERLVDVIEDLFAAGGLEAVTIEGAAQQMGVSRATLYRTVPTKEHLLALLFARMTTELGTAATLAVGDAADGPRGRLAALMAVHISAAVRMRHYLFVFFEGGRLPPDAEERWRRWRTEYERLWLDTVSSAAQAGVLRAEDPALATRLILGMCIWVSRWYRPERDASAERLADLAMDLIDRSEHG